ncbi:Protein CBR-STR-18 [Caenorhabditis briggsae]|uniref:Serpentine receptor class r-10 n=1 Tax=Caenorhabditis briggsae TaxID=6238 RepID=A8XB42_CAEBR|nr:Protein CBR-STR-18 [Caenorhabditis briggsae]CAP29822.2 Protein CBR-STR-18 [Caenorhabditis briggsae]
MVDWFMIDQTIAQIGFYLTTTSQFTLITLTLFFLRKNFGAYKYLILLFSGVGLAFASLEFMLYPILHYHKAGYIFFTTNRPLKASNELLVVLLAVFTGLYSTTISLLAVQYVYRYFAVFDKPRLKYFNRWYFIMWILYDTWFGFEGGVGIYKFNEADDYSREYMRREMRDVYGHDITDVPCMIHVVYEDISTNGSTIDYLIRWRCVICTINNAFIMMVQYGIMIYCGYRLYNDMEEKISMLSATMKKFHRQIFKTLFLQVHLKHLSTCPMAFFQITTPTIVLFSPIAFIMTLPYFDLEISVPTGVFLSGLALYPALDAFILICCEDFFHSCEPIVIMAHDKGNHILPKKSFIINGFFFVPVLHSHNAGYIFFPTNHLLNASNELLVVLLAVYTGIYSTTIALLAVQFIYRYFAVFDKPRLKYFNRWYFIMWLLYGTWFGFEWGIGFYKFNDYSREYMRQELRDIYGHDITDVPCMIHLVYEEIRNATTSDYLIRWSCVMCTINMTFIMMVQYGIMIYCGYRLYNDMEEKINMLSATMNTFHRQVFKSLVLQVGTVTS